MNKNFLQQFLTEKKGKKEENGKRRGRRKQFKISRSTCPFVYTQKN